MNAMRRRNMESRERAARDSLERTVALRTLALTQALDRLENAGARGRVRQAETIHRWAQASEYRDRGIADHVRRMSGYCALLGKWAGLHAESLELASVLHDVGKVAIVDTILLKPGPLMARERTHIETHADIGHAMLRDSCSSVLDLAAVVAWTHHERFDGGISSPPLGSAIPIVGRIAAIADVFDALTSDRVYRPAYTVDDALETMAWERDKHFDPELFDGFLALMDDVLAIKVAGVIDVSAAMPAAPSAPIQIVVVEDHPPVRQGLELLLPRHGFRMIGSAGSAKEGARLIRLRKPDVALVDIELGDGSGADLARAVADEASGTATVLYTASIDSAVIDDAGNSGACALVLKSSPIESLADAIRAAAAGRHYVDPSVARMCARRRDANARCTSAREAQVLELLARGLTTEQVARELFLSPETVKTHVRNATRNLGARGRLHAVILALVQGEIELPQSVG